MTDPEIPPGYTKPPMKEPIPLLQEDSRKELRKMDPRRLPTDARWVLFGAAILAFGFNIMGDQLGVGTAMIAILAASAFGETMHDLRDAEDEGLPEIRVRTVFDRATSNLYWTGLAVVPTAFLGVGIRQLAGLSEVIPT